MNIMIRQIKELKKCDAFDSFGWVAQNFNRYNLIYGWNGSGKTTLSRIFYSLEKKSILPELGPVEFSIKADSGDIKTTDINSHEANIKVFNEDFIRENLQFQSSKAKKILIVGQESENIADEIKELEKEEAIRQTKRDTLKDERSKIPALDSILTDAGREVVKQFANTPLANGAYSGRSYDKRKVETIIQKEKLDKTNLDSFIIAKQEEIDRKREIVKSQKNKITFIPSKVKDFSAIFTDANELLNNIVDVEVIEDLKEDASLREWVETGYKIHKDRDLKVCQFCKKTIDEGYLEKLAKFFTEELDNAKKDIDDAVEKLNINENKGNIGSVEANSFFPDISSSYLSIKSRADEYAVIIRAAIEQLVELLKDKKNNLHDASKTYDAIKYPTEAIQAINDASEKIQGFVTQHNNQIDNIFDATINLELHTIASVLKAKEYFQKNEKIKTLDTQVKEVEELLAQTKKKIKSKRAAVLNTVIAIDKINSALKEFFGESHIYIESDPSGADLGYVLKRRGRNAKNLSQGEKSVIALMYFLTKLEEDGFDLENSTIVIDDPVDSQDEIFLFKTFGLIKRYLTKSGQIIILTHNFPFFNLIRDWFTHSTYLPESALFLIRCIKNSTDHKASIENLPELLSKHKSEYQYLFYHLYSFSNELISIEDPLIPNIARKVLEYFAGFKWSCNVSEAFANIVQNRYTTDQDPITRGVAEFIIKFLNEYSHGQDFSRPITASTFEAKSIAENVLKFIKITDKEHYENLEKICQS